MANLKTETTPYTPPPPVNYETNFDPLGNIRNTNESIKRVSDTVEAERTRGRLLDHYLPGLLNGTLRPDAKELEGAITYTRRLLKQGSLSQADRAKLEASVNQLDALRQAMKAFMKGNASYGDVQAAVNRAQVALRAAGLLPKASRNPFNNEAAKVPSSYTHAALLRSPQWSAPAWVLQSNADRDIAMVQALDAAGEAYRQAPTAQNWKAFVQARNQLNKYFNNNRFVGFPLAGQEAGQNNGKVIQSRLVWANEQIRVHDQQQVAKPQRGQNASANAGSTTGKEPAWLRQSRTSLDATVKAGDGLLETLKNQYSTAKDQARQRWKDSNFGLLSTNQSVPLGQGHLSELLQQQRATIERFKQQHPDWASNPVLKDAVGKAYRMITSEWQAEMSTPTVGSPGAVLSGAWQAVEGLTGVAAGKFLAGLITDPAARAAAWDNLKKTGGGISAFVNNVMQGNFDAATQQLVQAAGNAAIKLDPKTPEGQAALTNIALSIIAAAGRPQQPGGSNAKPPAKPQAKPQPKPQPKPVNQVPVAKPEDVIRRANPNGQTPQQVQNILDQEFNLPKTPGNPGTQKTPQVPPTSGKPLPGNETTPVAVGSGNPVRPRTPTGTTQAANLPATATTQPKPQPQAKPIQLTPEQPLQIAKPKPTQLPTNKPLPIVPLPEIKPATVPDPTPEPEATPQIKTPPQAAFQPAGRPDLPDANGYTYEPGQFNQTSFETDAEAAAAAGGGANKRASDGARFYFVRTSTLASGTPPRVFATDDPALARRLASDPAHLYIGRLKEEPVALINDNKEVTIPTSPESRAVLTKPVNSASDLSVNDGKGVLNYKRDGQFVSGLTLGTYQGRDLDFARPVPQAQAEAAYNGVARLLGDRWQAYYEEGLKALSTTGNAYSAAVKQKLASRYANTKLDAELAKVDPRTRTSPLIQEVRSKLKGLAQSVTTNTPRTLAGKGWDATQRTVQYYAAHPKEAVVAATVLGIGVYGVLQKTVGSPQQAQNARETGQNVVNTIDQVQQTVKKRVETQPYHLTAEFKKEFGAYNKNPDKSALPIWDDRFLADPALTQRYTQAVEAYYQEAFRSEADTVINGYAAAFKKEVGYTAKNEAVRAFWSGSGNFDSANIVNRFGNFSAIVQASLADVRAKYRQAADQYLGALRSGQAAQSNRTAVDAQYVKPEVLAEINKLTTQANTATSLANSARVTTTGRPAALDKASAEAQIATIRAGYQTERDAAGTALAAIDQALGAIQTAINSRPAGAPVPKTLADYTLQLQKDRLSLLSRLNQLPALEQKDVTAVNQTYLGDRARQQQERYSARNAIAQEITNINNRIASYNTAIGQARSQTSGSRAVGADDFRNWSFRDGYWYLKQEFVDRTVKPLADGALSNNALGALVEQDSSGQLRRNADGSLIPRALNITQSQVSSQAEADQLEQQRQLLGRQLQQIDQELEQLRNQ